MLLSFLSLRASKERAIETPIDIHVMTKNSVPMSKGELEEKPDGRRRR